VFDEEATMNEPPHHEPRYWIAVASLDKVEAAVAGGYVEVSHGKAGPLERMRPGDRVAFYSPRTRSSGGEALQSFTALGEVVDAPLFQAAAAHQPFRRAVRWQGVTPAPVRPMLEALEFIRNKRHLGRRIPVWLPARGPRRLRSHRGGHGMRARERSRGVMRRDAPSR